MSTKYLVSSLGFFMALSLSACPASETGDTAQSSSTTESSAATEQAQTPPATTESPVSTQTASGDVELGKKVFLEKTCATCHAISSLEGAVGAVGPKMDGLAATAATRVAGKDAETYIRESIENPNAFVTEGYPAAMPALRTTMSDEEYEGLVAYLLTL